MIQDSAQIRRRGAQDFEGYYEYACARQDCMPLPVVKMNLAKGVLDFNADKIKLTDWPPILGSIAINMQLHHISVSSTYQAGAGNTDVRSASKKKIPAIRSKDMTLKLCKALRDCLSTSPCLKTLQINGLPLRERDLTILTKGLSKSASLENLSLCNCPIADEGLEVICQSVKYSSNIKTVDFTGCNLTWRGAEHMANIIKRRKVRTLLNAPKSEFIEIHNVSDAQSFIKHQGIRRHGTAWAESLRYRQPEFEGMGGLRRITMNCNTLIGDRGATALAHELAEDLWVKAVDLQKCGMSDEGARHLLEALKTNSSLCVLDIRSNPLVDKVLVKTIIEKVLMNADAHSSEYYWIKPPTFKEPENKAGPHRRAVASTGRGRATYRIASHRGPLINRRCSGVAQQQKQKPRSNTRHIPWRTAARAERQRGLPPGVAVAEQNFQGSATVKITLESDSEEEEEEDEVVVEAETSPPAFSLRDGTTAHQFRRMQMELEECRLRLKEERSTRLKAESRLMEYEAENAHLRSVNLSLSQVLSAPGPGVSVLEDEAVLESIESSFNKFHAFLDLLKDAGLGQLASIAGIDQSDFSLVGKPHLSSTIGQPAGGGRPLSGSVGGHQSSGEKIDAVGGPLPGPSGVAANSLSLRPPGSPRGFLLEDVPQDKLEELASSQADLPAGDPVLSPEGAVEEADHCSKPDEHHQDVRSGHSSCSHRSHGNDSQGNDNRGNGTRNKKGSHASGSHSDLSQCSQSSKGKSHHSNGNSHHSNSHSHHSNGHSHHSNGHSHHSNGHSHHSNGHSHHSNGHSHHSNGKSHHSNGSSHHSNGKSQHSNGSHGYSFNYTSVHSDGSHGNGSQSSISDLSVRSNISDIMSDKVESVESLGLRTRGDARRPLGVDAGAEALQVKPYSGLEGLEKVRSLGSVEEQSDDGSF